jgi:hypothetical protein
MKRRVLIGLAFLLVCVLVGTFFLVWSNTQAANNPMPNVVQIVSNTRPMSGKTAHSFSKRISDPAIVQHLYAAALAAPVPPKIIESCMIDTGVKFQLTFLKDTTVVQHMTLDPSGCPYLRIGSGNEIRKISADFWNTFRRATGLSDQAMYCLIYNSDSCKG